MIQQNNCFAPVIPEGWRLVPVEMTSDQIDKGVMAVVRAGKSGKSIDDQMRLAFEEMIFTAPPAPLRTEAEVRAEARREALEEAAKAAYGTGAYRVDAKTGKVTPLNHADVTVAAIRALIETEPT